MSVPTTARAARDLAETWLKHLPRDPRGFPVPWINRWGPETVASTRISWDPHVGRPAIFHDDIGGEPDFARQNMGRQREAIMTGLCQVCGRPCPWSRRNLALSGSTVEPVRLAEAPDRAVAAVAEPWLDDRCAAIASLLCPALIRRSHDDDLTIVPVRREKDARLLVSVGTLDVDKLAEAEAANPIHTARLRTAVERGPAAMWVKIVLLTHRIAFADPEPDDGAAVGHAALHGGIVG